MLPAAIVVVTPILVWLALDHLGKPTFVLIGAVGVVVAVYVGLYHPVWLYWGLAAVLAGVPFGYFLGVHLPMYLPLAFGVVLAAILYPRPEERFTNLEIAILVFVLVSGVSVVVTSHSPGGLIQYVRWSLVTLVAVALLRLSNKDLEKFGRIYVWVSAVNALWGILLVTVDRHQKSFALLQIFGYASARVDELVRSGRADLTTYSYTPGGVATLRLGGTWIGPNGAGPAFAIALVMCLILFRGWSRTCIAVILSAALLLTLSRQSIFTVLVGLALVLIFGTMRARLRWQALGATALLVIVGFSVPFVRDRILASFNPSEASATARTDALSDFPNQMSGHWLFGLGWARPEFKNGVVAYAINIVANSPLLTIYRAGIFAGLAFTAVVIIGCIMGYRALRSDSLPFAVFGGVFIAFCFVALQLDHGVTDIPQTTLCFSVLLAFLGYVDRLRRESSHPPSDTKQMELVKPPELVTGGS